jgi:hypothetical protein
MALIEVNWNPSPRELRQFAGIWFPLFFALVGGLSLYHTGSLAVAAAIWTPAAAISLTGFFFPKFMRLIYIGWMGATYPIGWVVSHTMLAAIYFLIMAPIGLLMRLLGRDPMQREFDRDAKSYWIAYNPHGDTNRYFRQF